MRPSCLRGQGISSKFEGNVHHPSRGRNCAKGPAFNQINDTERILHPMKRVGRGEGGWERVSWDQALDEISTKIRESTGAKDRVVTTWERGIHQQDKAWGVDGHNSHTNIWQEQDGVDNDRPSCQRQVPQAISGGNDGLQS